MSDVDSPVESTVETGTDFADLLNADQLQQCYRRHNVRVFLGTSGHTQVSISKELGYTNSTFLGQMVGAYPIRPITEKTVRKIEEKFNLEPLSLDKPAEITIDDLSEPDRKKLNLSETSLSEGFLLNKRKHARTDYSKYADRNNLLAQHDISTFRYGYDHAYAQVSTTPAAPTIGESTILELIDLIETSELNSAKAIKVLKMSVKDLFKKQNLDTEFVQNLIELSK